MHTAENKTNYPASVVRVHKRKRDEALEVVADRFAMLHERREAGQVESDACTTTSESSEDEGADDWEGMEPESEARKRRRLRAEEEDLRGELAGLRSTLVRVEAQVTAATAKLRELRAIVEQLVDAEQLER